MTYNEKRIEAWQNMQAKLYIKHCKEKQQLEKWKKDVDFIVSIRYDNSSR